MTDPKNPENKPEESKPASSGTYISARLREKLAESDDTEWTPKSSNPLPGILAVVVIVGLLAATFMWWQSSMKKQEAEKAAAAQKAAYADSVQTAARAESIATAVRADSTVHADSILAHGGKLPKPAAPAAAPKSAPTASKPAAPAPKGTTASKPAAAPAGTPAATTPAPKAVATDGFGIAVGQYMLEDRANAEKDKLSASTGLPGKVVPADDGGTTVYRVILGRYASRAPAEKKATALIDSSLVHEARVVARPK